jgi:alpha-tubulin suppressor-like RCC1 family protein
MRPGSIHCIAMGLLVGCYSPTLPENQPCSETQNCPESLTCDLASNECVSEVPEAARFVDLSAYAHHACGIDAQGGLWCWGRNQSSVLGLGDTDARLVPTRVGVESDWLAIEVGENVTCGVRAIDQLWCWGDDLETFPSNTLNPRQIAGSFKSVSVGFDAWCAIGTDDTLLCSRRGQVPVTAIEPTPIVPVQVAVTRGVVCAIDVDANLWCWGDNRFGQVGNGETSFDIPVPVATPNQITGSFSEVEIGDGHTCALLVDGRLMCWGDCQAGQLGRSQDCNTPTLVDSNTYTAVSAGDGHTCAIRDGKMVCFGENFHGELGSKGGRASSEPLEIELFGEWTAITAGNNFTCGLRGNDEAWCWGDNRFGQLGDDGGGTVFTPVAIDAGPFTQVVSGEANGCAIRDDGTLWCWGANSFGQLGDGSTFERRRPVQIGTDADWLAIAIERTFACGIRAPGTLWCWGDNRHRQLGIGGNSDVLVPTQVGIEDGWTEIAVIDEMGCGVLDGELQCWGTNRSSMPTREDVNLTKIVGQNQFFLAQDPTTGNAVSFSWFQAPLAESTTIADWTALEVGIDHACGLRGTELWCYGANGFGQLGGGDGSTTLEGARESTNGSWTTVSAGAQRPA